MDSQTKEELVEEVIHQASLLLEKIFPPQIVHVLRGEDGTVAELNEMVIAQVCDKGSMPGLSQQQKESTIRFLVNTFMDLYIDDTRPPSDGWSMDVLVHVYCLFIDIIKKPVHDGSSTWNVSGQLH